MKLKGLSKLVLAGTALAATAATLTTSTYAWYVTNSTVDATGVSGQVASTSTGSLYIAKNQKTATTNTPDRYRTEIALTGAATATMDDDLLAGKFVAQDLNPQSKTSSAVYAYDLATSFDSNVTTYYAKNGNSYSAASPQPTQANFANGTYYTQEQIANVGDWVDDKGKTIVDSTSGNPDARFITFSYWLKANTTGNVQVKLVVDNITSTATSQIALDPTGLPTGVSQGQSFYVDAVHALRMSVTKTVYDSAEVDNYVQATGTAVADVTYYADENGTALDSQPNVGADVTSYYVKSGKKTAYSVSATQDATPTHTYQVDQVALDKNGNNYSTATTTAVNDNGLTFATGGDANQYYCALTGDVPFGTDAANDGQSDDDSTGEDSWGTVALTANKDTLLEFKIWLEGSDKDCWDSCRGQQFTFAFNFSL